MSVGECRCIHDGTAGDEDEGDPGIGIVDGRMGISAYR